MRHAGGGIWFGGPVRHPCRPPDRCRDGPVADDRAKIPRSGKIDDGDMTDPVRGAAPWREALGMRLGETCGDAPGFICRRIGDT